MESLPINDAPAKKSTRWTPNGSFANAVTVTACWPTVLPEPGAVTATDGPVLSVEIDTAALSVAFMAVS